MTKLPLDIEVPLVHRGILEIHWCGRAGSGGARAADQIGEEAVPQGGHRGIGVLESLLYLKGRAEGIVEAIVPCQKAVKSAERSPNYGLLRAERTPCDAESRVDIQRVRVHE